MEKHIRFALYVLAGLLFLAAAILSETASGLTGEITDEMRDKGEHYLKAGQFAEAIGYFSGITEKNPDMYMAHYYLALAYYADTDLDKAESALKKTVELNPYYPGAFYHLALIEHKRGDAKKVIEYLNEVTSLDNTFRHAYYNRGVTFYAIGMPKRAIKEFAYALYLNPQDDASLLGIIKASQELNMITIHDTGVDDTIEVGFAKTKDPAPRAGVDTPEGHVDTARDMELVLGTGSHKKEIALDRDDPVEVIATADQKGILEINFPEPVNLEHKFIRMNMKGQNDRLKLSVVIRDSATKRSPPYSVRDITTDWKPFIVDIDMIAYPLDLEHIEHIRFELIPAVESPGEHQSILIRGVKIE